MQFLDLLGRELKSHEVVQILEAHSVDVVYEFDRHFEGMDDLYWASFYEQGFQFGFNQDQGSMSYSCT